MTYPKLVMAVLLFVSAALGSFAATYSDQGVSVEVPSGWKVNTALEGKNLVDIEAPDGFTELSIDSTTNFQGSAERWASAYGELMQTRMNMKFISSRALTPEEADQRGAESGCITTHQVTPPGGVLIECETTVLKQGDTLFHASAWVSANSDPFAKRHLRATSASFKLTGHTRPLPAQAPSHSLAQERERLMQEIAWRFSPAKISPEIESFRLAAREDMLAASLVFMTPQALETFRPVRDFLAGAWRPFFSTAVYTVCYQGAAEPLVLFYHPWSDTALITQWREENQQLRITDLELVQGGLLRDPRNPILQPEPYWRRIERPPPLAVTRAVRETLVAFRTLFAPAAPGQWRNALPALADRSMLDACQLVSARALLETTLLQFQSYSNEPKYGALRRSVDRTLRDAASGRLPALYSHESETPAATRTLLRSWSPDQWRQLGFCSALLGEQESYVFLGAPENPGQFLCLYLRAEQRGPRLVRLDLMSHEAYSRLAAERRAP